MKFSKEWSLCVESIAKPNRRPVNIARHILFWAAWCFRLLDISELEVVLKSAFDGFKYVGVVSEEICAQFVVVLNNKNKSKLNSSHGSTASPFENRRWTDQY